MLDTKILERGFTLEDLILLLIQYLELTVPEHPEYVKLMEIPVGVIIDHRKTCNEFILADYLKRTLQTRLFIIPLSFCVIVDDRIELLGRKSDVGIEFHVGDTRPYRTFPQCSMKLMKILNAMG